MPLAPSPANDQVGEIKHSSLAATIPNPPLSHLLTVLELTLCTGTWLTSQPGTGTEDVLKHLQGWAFPSVPSSHGELRASLQDKGSPALP